MTEGEQIKEWLDELGWTQKKFAKVMNMSPNQVSRIVTGKCKVPGCMYAYLRLMVSVRRHNQRK